VALLKNKIKKNLQDNQGHNEFFLTFIHELTRMNTKKTIIVNIHQTTSLSVVAKLALPQSKLCNYSSANLSGSLVGEAKGLALHLSDDTGLTELLLF